MKTYDTTSRPGFSGVYLLPGGEALLDFCSFPLVVVNLLCDVCSVSCCSVPLLPPAVHMTCITPPPRRAALFFLFSGGFYWCLKRRSRIAFSLGRGYFGRRIVRIFSCHEIMRNIPGEAKTRRRGVLPSFPLSLCSYYLRDEMRYCSSFPTSYCPLFAVRWQTAHVQGRRNISSPYRNSEIFPKTFALILKKIGTSVISPSH